jgi:predicted O-methyltransferase YrrM
LDEQDWQSELMGKPKDVASNGNPFSGRAKRLRPVDSTCGVVLNKADEIISGDDVQVAFMSKRPGNHDRGKYLVDMGWPARATVKADTASISEGEAMLLSGLVASLRPRICFETGTHRGRSSKAILEGLAFNQQGHLYTVDADDYHTLDYGTDAREKSYLTQIVGHTPEVFREEPLKSLQGIDFAFIDGDHTEEGLRADLQYVIDHQAEKCWVLIDNALDPMWPDVEKLLKDWAKFTPCVSMETMTGMTLMVLEGI